MRRIAIVGPAGSGKTTLARQLADGLGLTHIELDHLYHRSGWREVPPEQFRTDLVAAMAAASGGWVVCGNYQSRAQGLHTGAADTIVWLDLPRRTVMRRLILRTVRRTVTREKPFGYDMVEPLANFYRWDPNHNIVRGAWVHFDRYRESYGQGMTDGCWDHRRAPPLLTRRRRRFPGRCHQS